MSRLQAVALTAVMVICWVVTQPLGLYFGAWGLLGGVYNDPKAVVMGFFVALAPFVITLFGLVAGWRAERREPGRGARVMLIPAICLMAGLAMALHIILAIGAHR